MHGGRLVTPGRVAALVCAALLSGAACAARGVDLPAGDGTPFPGAAAAYDTAVQGCRGVRSFEATLALSGRAGSQALRGNLDAGFEAPASLRLEMRAPIGRPVFILAAAGAGATLFLPRDNRVLRHPRPADIVEALVGLPLDPGDLHALVSGCGFGVAEAAGGRSYPGGWVAVETGNAVTYLRDLDGQWRVAGATRPPLSVRYSAFTQSGRPSTLRVQATGGARADLTVRLSDVNINVPLAPAVFAVEVPAGAEPLSLEELRRAGPLGRP